MATKPYFSKKQVKDGKISFLTDKIAFFYFILRLMVDSLIENLSN